MRYTLAIHSVGDADCSFSLTNEFGTVKVFGVEGSGWKILDVFYRSFELPYTFCDEYIYDYLEFLICHVLFKGDEYE
jgi:hypothetical protein